MDQAWLLASCARLLEELSLDHLLLARGGPVLGEGRVRLEDLLDAGRTAFSDDRAGGRHAVGEVRYIARTRERRWSYVD